MGEGEGIWAWCTDNNWGKHKVSVCYHKERLSILFPDSVNPLSHTWPRNGSICSCKTVCGEGNSHRLPYSGMSDQFLQVYFFQLISSWCNYKHLLLLIGYSRICNVVFCCLWGKRNKPCKCGWSFKLQSCAVIQGEPLTLLVALCYFPVHGTLLGKIDQIWNPFGLNYIFWLAVFFSFQQKQVLCHLPLPLHEWPIAPRPHVQLVKMRGKFACKSRQRCALRNELFQSAAVTDAWDANIQLVLLSQLFLFAVCCWIPVSEREEMPLPIRTALHRNANQS